MSMRKIKQFLLAALFFFAFSALSQPLLAQDSEVTDDEVNEVARDIYCPVCESTPLDVCATQACADWRELIRTKLSDGQSKQEIFDYFARQYGEGVLANPPQRGISLIILWILPVVLLLVGVLLFSRVLRNLRSTPEPVVAASVETETAKTAEAASRAPSADKAQDEYLARVEEELGKK